MKNKLFKIFLPTLVAILIRLVWEFVFGFNLHSSDGWNYILGCVAVLWAILTIVIVVMEVFID
jgi:hypothetical protein